MDSLAPSIDAAFDDLVDLRRDLHAHPELSFEERRTSEVLVAALEGLGLEIRRCPTETGAVALLRGARPGPTVLLRADIDALPVREAGDLAFASSAEGRMHACGHDAHAAILVGAASALATRASDLAGSYVFVFQPAEERISGAKAMLGGGLLDDLDADGLSPAAAIGCHVTSMAPSGLIGVRPGVIMADAQAFRVELTGAGGHGAVKDRVGDVVMAAARLVSRLESVVTGIRFEGVDGVCTSGLLHAGTAGNVVPTSAIVEGTIRTFSTAQAEEAAGRLRGLVATIGLEGGVTGMVDLYAHAPAVDNDETVNEVVRAAALRSMAPATVFTMPPVTPSDDMSEFLLRMPGCYFFVGAGLADGTSGGHHSPTFAIDEEAIRIGATVLADAAVDLGRPA